ncbi:unnamed protein product, partial [marine sediment metagenome]
TLLVATLAGAGGGYIYANYLAPTPEEIYEPESIYFYPGFQTKLTPANSWQYGYRLAMENGAITTVGATVANGTAQAASIASSVTPQTSHIILYVEYSGNATSDYVELWTSQNNETKYKVMCLTSVINITDQVILPFDYNTPEINWELSDGDLLHSVTIYLWGYFERPTATR